MQPIKEILSQSDIEFKSNLLKQFYNKQITFAEFQQECAYWALNCGWADIYYRQYPTRPEKLKEYDTLSFAEKRDIRSNFWLNPEIEAYLHQCKMVDALNTSNLYWLEKWRDIFKANNDIVNQKKCEEKLKEWQIGC